MAKQKSAKPMTVSEAGRKGARNRWKDIPPEVRSEQMRQLALNREATKRKAREEAAKSAA